MLAGIALRAHPGVIAVEVFGAIAAPQFAFVAVSLTDHLIRRTRLIPQVRAAIGQQLRDELEVPRSLPRELATLVTQLALRLVALRRGRKGVRESAAVDSSLMSLAGVVAGWVRDRASDSENAIAS